MAQRRNPPQRNALRHLRTFVTFAAFLCAMWLVEREYMDPLLYIALVGVVLGVTLISLQPLAPVRPHRVRRPALDAFAERDARAHRVRLLRSVFVVDGDTLDDNRTGIRYRFQNIDAPETGDNALCNTERLLGERAKWEAIRLVRAAKKVEARPTGEIDQYGRTLAYILLDGADLGETLIARGLAHPWRGRRELWCGPDGSLLTIARQRGDAFFCEQCRLQWKP